jgi:hypothetical protein
MVPSEQAFSLPDMALMERGSLRVPARTQMERSGQEWGKAIDFEDSEVKGFFCFANSGELM